MALRGKFNYDATMREFSAHWIDVNAALGSAPLVLPGAFALTNFTQMQATLSDAENQLMDTQTRLAFARNTTTTQKKSLLKTLEQFRMTVIGVLNEPTYNRALPTLPLLTSSPSRFTQPMEKAVELWTLINATPLPGFTPPLVLPGGVTLAMFQDALAAYQADLLAVTGLLVQEKMALETRDLLLPAARARMREYRIAVPARLGLDAPLAQDMPRLTPLRKKKSPPVLVMETMAQAA